MSRIEEMIKELCPNGVEYRLLQDVSVMKRGTAITRKDIKNGDIPVIAGGQKPAYYCSISNRTGNIITIAGSGAYAGYVAYWESPIFVSDAFSIQGTDDTNTKYLYYVLLRLQDKIYATKRGSGVPHVHIKSIADFRIPVPPIEIQNEIVNILDKFTELEARRKQYEYYRNKLLNFSEIAPPRKADVKWLTMSEIGDICMCKRIMKNQTNTIGGVPFYKIGTFGKNADAYISQELYNDYKSRYSFPQKGEILISASGTIGRAVIYDGQDAYFQDSNIVWIHNDEDKVLNKYLYYYYQIVKWYGQ